MAVRPLDRDLEQDPMTTKQTIIAELGDQQILAPDRIAESLIANDRVKYYFALLQTARANADHPIVPPPNLRAERLASRLDDVWLDDVVAATRQDRGGCYRVPHGLELLRRIQRCIDDMLVCLPDAEQAELRNRLARLDVPEPRHGAIPGALISTIASGDRKAGDSLHLVVMDAHRAINKLQMATAIETLAGARVHRLSPGGRARVEAFMSGLNRTAPLKFDHPGLGTTATEHEGRLLIQNDIGTTDAHVLVVRVDDRVVTIAYTDIHKARLKFFTGLFKKHGVVWEKAEVHQSDALETGQYTLATGRFEGKDGDAVTAFLAYLGSRIVYLIDWNRMRKRLRGFVSKDCALDVLEWAAQHDYGHRALLEIGGEEALAEAVEYAAGAQLRYGQRLDRLISEERAGEFLREAFRIASLGLQQRRSRRNIKDEIKARLRGLFEHERLKIFDLAADHTAIAYDIAVGLADGLGRLPGERTTKWVEDFAGRASVWEKSADQCLNEARDDIKRFSRSHYLLAFFESSDDAVDELEEAAALLELTQLIDLDAAALDRLRDLARLPLMSAQELVKSVECAASITRADIRDDLDEFMLALERLMAIEHEADDALRGFRRWLIQGDLGERQLMVLRDLGQTLEQATDAHAHAGQSLRAYLMEEVIA